jgi:hypothetical protein
VAHAGQKLRFYPRGLKGLIPSQGKLVGLLLHLPLDLCIPFP